MHVEVWVWKSLFLEDQILGVLYIWHRRGRSYPLQLVWHSLEAPPPLGRAILEMTPHQILRWSKQFIVHLLLCQRESVALILASGRGSLCLRFWPIPWTWTSWTGYLRPGNNVSVLFPATSGASDLSAHMPTHMVASDNPSTDRAVSADPDPGYNLMSNRILCPRNSNTGFFCLFELCRVLKKNLFSVSILQKHFAEFYAWFFHVLLEQNMIPRPVLPGICLLPVFVGNFSLMCRRIKTTLLPHILVLRFSGTSSGVGYRLQTCVSWYFLVTW